MNILCALLLMVMTIMTLLTVVDGSCYTIPPHYAFMGSKTVIACEHDHMEYMVGSVIRTTDCDECTCTESGMHCCGDVLQLACFANAYLSDKRKTTTYETKIQTSFGHKAGAIQVPEGHKIEHYQCDYEIVKIGRREIIYDN